MTALQMTILLNGKTAVVRICWTHDSSSDDSTAKWENCSSKNSLNESSSHDKTAKWENCSSKNSLNESSSHDKTAKWENCSSKNSLNESSSHDKTAKWENWSSKNSLNESSSHDKTATVLVENCRTLGVKSTKAEEVESQFFFFLGNPAAKSYNLLHLWNDFVWMT